MQQAEAEEGQEPPPPCFWERRTPKLKHKNPLPPKVTCMGQVRVKRSATKRVDSDAKRVPSAGAGAPTKCRCCSWVPHALFFHRFRKPGFSFPFQCKQVRPNWGFLKRKKTDSKVTETSSPKTELNFRGRHNPSYDDSERIKREDGKITRLNEWSYSWITS